MRRQEQKHQHQPLVAIVIDFGISDCQPVIYEYQRLFDVRVIDYVNGASIIDHRQIASRFSKSGRSCPERGSAALNQLLTQAKIKRDVSYALVKNDMFQHKIQQRHFLQTHHPSFNPPHLEFKVDKINEDAIQVLYEQSKQSRDFVIKVPEGTRGEGNYFISNCESAQDLFNKVQRLTQEETYSPDVGFISFATQLKDLSQPILLEACVNDAFWQNNRATYRVVMLATNEHIALIPSAIYIHPNDSFDSHLFHHNQEICAFDKRLYDHKTNSSHPCNDTIPKECIPPLEALGRGLLTQAASLDHSTIQFPQTTPLSRSKKDQGTWDAFCDALEFSSITEHETLPMVHFPYHLDEELRKAKGCEHKKLSRQMKNRTLTEALKGAIARDIAYFEKYTAYVNDPSEQTKPADQHISEVLRYITVEDNVRGLSKTLLQHEHGEHYWRYLPLRLNDPTVCPKIFCFLSLRRTLLYAQVLHKARYQTSNHEIVDPLESISAENYPALTFMNYQEIIHNTQQLIDDLQPLSVTCCSFFKKTQPESPKIAETRQKMQAHLKDAKKTLLLIRTFSMPMPATSPARETPCASKRPQCSQTTPLL